MMFRFNKIIIIILQIRLQNLQDYSCCTDVLWDFKAEYVFVYINLHMTCNNNITLECVKVAEAQPLWVS